MQLKLISKSIIALVAYMFLISSRAIFAADLPDFMLDVSGEFLIAGSVEHNACIANAKRPSIKKGDSFSLAIGWEAGKTPEIHLRLATQTNAWKKQSFTFNFSNDEKYSYKIRKTRGFFIIPLSDERFLGAINKSDFVKLEHQASNSLYILSLKNASDLIAKLERCLKWLI